MLSRNLAPALDLLADVVQNPTFPEEEIARERKRVLDALAQADRNGNALASRIQPMLAFGPDHPYGRPVQGLKGSVEGHHARGSGGVPPGAGQARVDGHRAGRRHLAGAGDRAGDASTSAGGPAARRPTSRFRRRRRRRASRIYLVDRPDAAQTVVAQWIPGPARTTPDYDVLNLVDAVWGGGGFGTRLNLNLRENKAYSYGVFSNFNLMRAAGNWTAAGGVQTDKTAESIVEFDKELKDLAGARPITRRRAGRSPSSGACAATRSSSSRSTASPARSPTCGRGVCRPRSCSASTTRPTR